MSLFYCCLLFKREVASDPFVDSTELPTLSLSILYLLMNTLFTTLVEIDALLPREWSLIASFMVRESSLAYPFHLQGISTSLTESPRPSCCSTRHRDVGWDNRIPHDYHHGLMEPTRLSHDTIMSLMRSTRSAHDFRHVVLIGTHRVRPLRLQCHITFETYKVCPLLP